MKKKVTAPFINYLPTSIKVKRTTESKFILKFIHLLFSNNNSLSKGAVLFSINNSLSKGAVLQLMVGAVLIYDSPLLQ